MWPVEANKKTKLETARDLLAETDQKIVSLLQHFEAASNPPLLPNADLLAKYMTENKLPREIEEIAIMTNTPVSLIAGVAQFITPKSLEGNLDIFKELAKEVCNRHKHTWLVVEHKTENRTEFLDENNKVKTFVKEQHDRVVNRAKTFAKEVIAEKGTVSLNYSAVNGLFVKSTNDNTADEDPYEKLSQNVVNFLAATGAGWQSEGINKNIGPFSKRQEFITNDNIFRTLPVYPPQLKAA